MKIQRSNIDVIPTLYLVPTPIGNFDDMTYRSVEVLKNVDIIYCEDTRVTKVLLSHFAINTPLKNYHIFNEEIKSDEILDLLKEISKTKLVVIVSHNLQDANNYSDRIIELSDGKVLMIFAYYGSESDNNNSFLNSIMNFFRGNEGTAYQIIWKRQGRNYV